MFLLYVSTKLFRPFQFQFLYDHDWKSIKSGSEFTLEDSMVYSCKGNSKLPESKKWVICYKSIKIIRIHTKFGFRPIRITLNSWDTKFAICKFFYHIWSYGCATFDDAVFIYLTNELSWRVAPTI